MKLTGGAIADIVVGVLAAIAIVVSVVVFCVKKRRKRHTAPDPQQNQTDKLEDKPQLHGESSGRGEIDGTSVQYLASEERHELPYGERRQQHRGNTRYELEGRILDLR